jgi:class 3 adenylate cyclase/CHASE2 domain-containing sensor protein
VPVKFQPRKQAPVLIAFGVIIVVSLMAIARLDFFERQERMTYDWRARTALHFSAPIATNLGCVFITDDCIRSISRGLLERRYGLYWPRHIYGRALRELSAQEARAVGLDVMFTDRRSDHAPFPVAATPASDLEGFLKSLHPTETIHSFEQNGAQLILVESDEFLAWQLKRSGLGLLASERGVRPHQLFATNALGVGDISADLDSDGVLRRAMAFRSYTNWHFLLQLAEADPELSVDLSRAVVAAEKIVLPRTDLPPVEIPLDTNGLFRVADFIGDELPAGLAPTARPFTVEKVWHMGIVLAARELQLDLTQADVDLPARRITLRGPNGITRVLPVDANGYFFINWEITPGDPRLVTASFSQLLLADQARSRGTTAYLENRWRNKLVVIGSAATGNDLTDHGATPLQKDTLLVSKHWNVANSIITGRFVHPVSVRQEIALIALLGFVTAVLTWRLRALPGLLSVLGLASLYTLICLTWFAQQRLWLPMVLPIAGALFVQYGLLVTYRVVFEQRERRRVKSVFSKIVSPDVVNELLEAEKLSLGGARREVTVMFADVRGFTELTDKVQEQTATDIQQQRLNGVEAEKCYDAVAEQTLQMISLYLGLIADTVKTHSGTLDKYIGDCTMAFWGAPKANPQHALHCIRAAIDAQRGIHALNETRRLQNAQLEIENRARLAAGLPAKPLFPLLSLGTGINSGMVMVGLMGSDAHGLNYTVLGREVNLASRLEAVSGRGRIIIGETTYEHLLRDDPALAATCVEQEPTKPKGFQKPVRNFEVPWQI